MSNLMNTKMVEQNQGFDLPTIFRQKLEDYRGLAAIDDGIKQYSYSELLVLAESLGQFLIQQGATSKNPIGIDLSRSSKLVICMVACILHKLPFILFNNNWPLNKKNRIINIAKPFIILSKDDEESEIFKCETFSVNWKTTNFFCGQALLQNNSFSYSIAYLATSSGSSGDIKCAMVGTRGLMHLMQQQSEYFKLQPQQIVLQIATPGFDAIISEVLVSLYSGVILRVMAVEDKLLVPQIRKLLDQGIMIDLVTMTPSVAECLAIEQLLKIKTLVLAGEAANFNLVSALIGKIRVINAYGPCETTVCSHMHDVVHSSETRCIGKVLPYLRAKVMNELGQPIESGIGELWIYGDAVGYGYLGENDNSFGFDPIEGLRYYKTKDLVDVQPNKDLYFIGRIDQNIKIRGQMVSIPEIVNTALQCESVNKAFAFVTKNKDLALFYEGDIQKDELQYHLRQKLSDVSIPKHFFKLDKLPLNDNGKVDLSKLQEMVDGLKDNQAHINAANDSEHPILTILERILDSNAVNLDDNFFDIGGDSLKIVDLMCSYSEHYGADMDLTLFLKAPTARNLISLSKDQIISADPFEQFKKDIASLNEWSIKNIPNKIGNTIILTGATGRIGQVILEHVLTYTSLNIICMGRADKSAIDRVLIRRKIDLSKINGRLKYIGRDFNDAKSIRACLDSVSVAEISDIFAIVHCGAMVNHVFDLQSLYQSNVSTVYNLLEICHQHKISKFIYLGSTSAVSPENRMFNTHAGYDVSKGMAEELVRMAKNKGINSCILKLPLVYDLDQMDVAILLKDHFICRTLQCLDMRLIPKNNAFVACAAAADCANVILSLCRDPETLPQELVTMIDNGILWHDLFKLILEGDQTLLTVAYEEWRSKLLQYATENPRAPLMQFINLYKEQGIFYNNMLPYIPDLTAGKAAFVKYIQEKQLTIQNTNKVFAGIVEAIQYLGEKR